jgi:ribosomal-protein-serine acetyltransferase
MGNKEEVCIFSYNGIIFVSRIFIRTLKINRVEIQVAVNNHKSIAIPERLGFVSEGIKRDGQWLYDHYEDIVTYSMLAKDWIKK